MLQIICKRTAILVVDTFAETSGPFNIKLVLILQKLCGRGENNNGMHTEET